MYSFLSGDAFLPPLCKGRGTACGGGVVPPHFLHRNRQLPLSRITLLCEWGALLIGDRFSPLVRQQQRPRELHIAFASQAMQVRLLRCSDFFTFEDSFISKSYGFVSDWNLLCE